MLAAACLTAALPGHSLGTNVGPAASEASALSALPIAVSVAAPALVLSGGVRLTAIAVEASAQGTVWTLERMSDGARMSVLIGSAAAGTLSMAIGTVLEVSAIGAGWLLSAAGQALAFIPNEVGKALLYNEQVTR
ncbi:hypothetical protein [Piscinibacter sakaiensis]|uniref:hypothetical protein n=1 Tax=Piscinibacter sakaiensis TaxID=1547922 RepID=UPI003AAAEFAD